jgi:chaperonin GroES
MTVSGIVLPDTAKEKPQRGRVLAVGPGNRSEQTGEADPARRRRGDEVIFSKYGGPRSSSAPTRLLILRESDVLAKVVSSRCQGQGQEVSSPAPRP